MNDKSNSQAADDAPATEAPAPKRTGVNALERGLRLLSVVNVPGGLTLSESARRAGLNKTTALRLFRSLERMDFVLRVQDRYSPGPAVAALRVELPATAQGGLGADHGQRMAALTV